MADDKITPAAGDKPAVGSGPKGRKYTFKGIAPRNPKVSNIYGNVKIKPWAMTDEEIDALLKRVPELARLWTVTSA